MNNTIGWIRYALKAVYAGAAALVAGVVIALTPDSAGVSSLTTLEIWVIAGSVIAAVGGVFGLQNGPKPTEDEHVERPSDGV